MPSGMCKESETDNFPVIHRSVRYFFHIQKEQEFGLKVWHSPKLSVWDSLKWEEIFLAKHSRGIWNMFCYGIRLSPDRGFFLSCYTDSTDPEECKN